MGVGVVGAARRHLTPISPITQLDDDDLAVLNGVIDAYRQKPPPTLAGGQS